MFQTVSETVGSSHNHCLFISKSISSSSKNNITIVIENGDGPSNTVSMVTFEWVLLLWYLEGGQEQ